MNDTSLVLRRDPDTTGRVRYLPRPRLFAGRLARLRRLARIAALESGLDVHVIPHPAAGSGRFMIRLTEIPTARTGPGVDVVNTYVRSETFWSAYALFRDIAHRRALPAYVRTSSDSSSIERGHA